MVVAAAGGTVSVSAGGVEPLPELGTAVVPTYPRHPNMLAVQALTTQYHEHPGWSAQLHHDNLRVTLAAAGHHKSTNPLGNVQEPLVVCFNWEDAKPAGEEAAPPTQA